MRKMTLKAWLSSFYTLRMAILFIFLVSSPAFGFTAERFSIDLNGISLVLNPESNSASLDVSSSHLNLPDEWEVKKISDQQFHVRRSAWKGLFWSIDIKKQEVRRVTEGSFGQPGGPDSPLTQIKAYVNKLPEGRRLRLAFPSVSLNYEAKENAIRLTVDGAELIDSTGMESMFNPSNRKELCQIRHRMWGDRFFEIDLKEKKVSWAFHEKFGNGYGSRQNFMNAKVTVEYPRIATGMFDDQGFIDNQETRRPQSAWIEARKTRYRDILKGQTYDVLLVPCQVQGYAVDRVSRSLMTRYLADRIATTTGLRIPDPTLVARALGEDARTFDEKDVFSLANDLKVKLVIVLAAGHNRDERMKLAVLTQKADGYAFSSTNKSIRINWGNVPFSDEHLPEAAFKELLDEMMAKLPLRVTGEPTQPLTIKASPITIPADIVALTTEKPASAVIAAYYLQFLGMLFPEDTTQKEHLFERSLIVLDRISPESPDYRLLKARALFYLHRRPAALAALGTPVTPEEKGFAAYLNGNLPTLKKTIAEIVSPLPKLMAQIETIDLRWAYKERVTGDDYRKVVDGLPGWEILLVRRMQTRDPWFSLPNLFVKEQMDRLFPVKGYTAKDLLAGKISLAEVRLDDPDMALSVHEHYRRYLDTNVNIQQQAYGNQYASQSDSLDLFHDLGWANLLQDLKIDLDNRDLASETLERLGRYEKVYRDHPAMTYLKGSALASQWKGKKELEYLLSQRDELAYQACYWSGGQVGSRYASSFPPYDADYPHRPFWSGIGGDRLQLKGEKLYDSLTSDWKEQYRGEKEYAMESLKDVFVRLKYTNDSFYPVKRGYELLSEQYKRAELAGTFLGLKRDRFEGHPDRIQFDVAHADGVEDPTQKIKALEAAIVAAPDLWKSYEALGDLYIRQGEFKKAQETFLKYPLFKGEEGDHVMMSNAAFGAAVDIFWRGGVDESIPLFRIAAGSNTGSGAEMFAAGILALVAGDYSDASMQFLRLIKRYDDAQGYREYLTLLHTGGLHQEAWSIFNTIDIQTNSPDIWTSVFVGQRMERKNGAQIADGLIDGRFNRVGDAHIGNFLLLSLLTDRAPDRTAPDLIMKVLARAKSSKEQIGAQHGSEFADFVRGFYLLRTNQFEQAYQVFDGWISNQSFIADYAVPYLAFCAIKNKKTIPKLMQMFKVAETDRQSSGYADSQAYYHMAKAYEEGLQGNHQKAIEELKKARFSLPYTRNRPFSPWYQLVETCEWLYNETGYQGYRTLAVEWAKIHQRIKPYFAWAYAVEAKYAESETDRVKALAIAIYLDQNSERIAGLADKDKTTARKWLEQHKPFALDEAKGQVQL